MRRLLSLMCGLAAAVAVGTAAPAQDWPTRTLTMVVPFAAGGPTDAFARILQPTLSEALGQQIIIENIPGGSGMTGSLRVANAALDSHQFVLGTIGTHAISQLMHKKPAYNAVNDFQPVSLIADAPLVLIVKKDLPATNLQEFIAYTKANHARMQFSSGGTGTSSHIACVMLNQIIGVNVTHIPYRGGGPALQDLIAGRIDYICNYVSTALPAVNAGQAKALAALAAARTAAFPNLPTANEQGFKDFDVSAWNAILLPKSATPAMTAKLNAALGKAMDHPAMKARLDSLGLIATPPARRGPEYLRRYLASEIEKWRAPVKAAGIAFD